MKVVINETQCTRPLFGTLGLEDFRTMLGVRAAYFLHVMEDNTTPYDASQSMAVDCGIHDISLRPRLLTCRMPHF